MAGKVKKVGLIILLLVLTAVTVGYFVWNKPHRDVSTAAGIETNAVDLYQAFITDSSAANAKYIDKIAEVTGTVKAISANQQQQQVLALQTKAGDASVNCTMEQNDATIKDGMTVTVKGICTGIGEGDAELGIMGDVYLIRCYIAK